jgi:hypothetical protein
MVSVAPQLQAEFGVSYEGPAFAENAMDVRDLAPALLALGQAFDRTNVLLNGDRAAVRLSIRATRPGSFEIVLFLQQLLDGASDILTGDYFTSAANLTDVLFGGGTVAGGMSLFRVLKRLRGQKPRTTAVPERNGVWLRADNIELFVSTDTARLYADRPLRDQVEAFIRPLSKEGVERVVFKQDQEEQETVRRDEAPYFSAEDDESPVTQYIIPRQRLQITSLAFNRDGKWRLSDGANVHWYAMEDQDFTRAIQAGRRFGRDDILLCEVIMTQRLEENGKLRMDYAVRHVLQHILPGEQSRMDLGSIEQP